jgi:hypothetical protein
MRGQSHTQIIQPSLQPPTKPITSPPQTITLIQKEGQCKSSYTQQLPPQNIKPRQILQKLRLVGFKKEAYNRCIDHVPNACPPGFGEDSSFPSSPDPSGGRIELHHYGLARGGSDGFVNEVIEEDFGGCLFDDAAGGRKYHVQGCMSG